jgi:amino acid adenylation domain-containing protein/non-ribosomal peptide synthase protein (TIGR01720 family)
MTSIRTLEFLAYLRSLDIKLSVNEDRLRYNAPEGVLTPNLRAELVQRKAEIIEFLRQIDTSAPAKALAIQPVSREGYLPLSFAQQRLWFFDQLEPDNFAYNEVTTFRLTGSLDMAALERSFSEIVRRHEILRTTFITVEGQAAQVIHPFAGFKISVVDFRNADRPNAEAEAFIHAEIQQSFDLARGPLLRVHLLRLEAETYILLATLHHIVTDGWSEGVLIKELTALYQYFVNGAQEPYPLPELAIQYIDFAYWQRQWLQGPVLENQAAYWERQLGGNLPLLQLPTDHLRPPAQTYQGTTYSAKLPDRLVKSLQQLSQQEGATLFMTFLAAFKALLYRYTAQEDMLIGTPIANRNRSEIETLIGFFVNTLILRTRLDGNPTFRQLLHRVRETALGAYAHQDLPFEKLIETLQPERNLSHQPLFQVMFVFENAAVPALHFPGVTATPLKIKTGAARFDLTLFIEGDQEGLSHIWEYNSDLFEADTIGRMAGHFQTLLEGIVTGGVEQRLSDLPLLTEAEKRQQLIIWNQTQADYPADQCFHQLFEAQAARTPDRVALVFEEQRLTYLELNQRANRLAHYLQKQGAGPETLVALCMERSLDMVIGLLGILKAGAAYVPLDPAYPPLRLAFMLEDSQAPLLLTQQWLVDRLGVQDRREPGEPKKPILLCLDRDWEAVAQESVENPGNPVLPDHLAYVIYTSGSTGQPKGTMITQQGLVNYLSWAGQAYRVSEGQGAPVHSSLSFDLTITGLFLPLLAGRTVTLLPEDQMAEALPGTLRAGQDFSLVKITPAHLELLNRQLSPERAVGATRSLVIGGEALFGEDIRFWQSHAPDTRLINEYGPTETVVGCCVYEVPPGTVISGAVPIGRPIANTQLYLLDQYLQLVPVGVPAELYIGGASLARGYLGRPDLTAERFIPNPFNTHKELRMTLAPACSAGENEELGIENEETNLNQPDFSFLIFNSSLLYKTGDLARYRPDGVLEFLGRLDQQVKIRGFRVELGEIEIALSQHPAVKEAVVLARSAVGSDNKRLVAYIVPQPAGDEMSPSSPEASNLVQELRQFLQARLPAYMTPAIFVLLDAFPLTPNGKLDQRALPDPDTSRPEPAGTFVASRTQTETILARIWADLLGLKQVGVYDNFFELGGDSILIIQVVARASQAGLRLTPRQLFQYQTIAELAAVAHVGPMVQTEQGQVTGEIPLTPIQYWFFEKNLAKPQHWNMAMLLEVGQKLEPRLLQEAVDHLLNHHDALRLRFKRTETGWRQFNTGLEPEITSFVRVDLSDAAPAEQKAILEKQAGELQASLNLAAGPLIRVALFELGAEQPDRLLIVIHHLAMDGVSWRILLEDLQTVCHQLSRGKPAKLPPKTTSFQQWARLLHQVVKQPQTEKGWQPEPEYWLAEARRWVPKLPVDDPAGKAANTEASAEVVSVWLDEAETTLLLQEVPAVYHTQINDLLLTALVQAFAPWTGSAVLLLDLEGHGREEIAAGVDLSRTVGWFTTIFPVYLDLEGISEPGEAIKAIKEQLRRIPSRGIDYSLLRYLGAETIQQKLRSLPLAEISFNYLGRFDQFLSTPSIFKPAPESSGPDVNPHNHRTHLLEVVGAIVAGRLQLKWFYSRNIHRQATVESLSRRFIEALQALIAHCQSPEAGGYTPSDFPEAELTQAELDNLLATLNDL